MLGAPGRMASTVRPKAWPTVKGPLPVLLSVAETLRVKLPACVGVPLMVTVLAVVPVMLRPAGRFVTWYSDHGGAPPSKLSLTRPASVASTAVASGRRARVYCAPVARSSSAQKP